MRFDNTPAEATLMNQLPTWFKPVLEYIELMKAHGFELDNINTIGQQIYYNFFIQTADEATIAQWENHFGIVLNFGDTLEFRRQRVLQKFEQEIPYTIWNLRDRLTYLYGEDYSLTLGSPKWVKGSDGFYYFVSYIEADSYTDVFIDSISALRDGPTGYSLSVHVTATAIQADVIVLRLAPCAAGIVLIIYTTPLILFL